MVFGDDVVVAAMIDRLVHHAEVIDLEGDSYRLKNRDLDRHHGDHSGRGVNTMALHGPPNRRASTRRAATGRIRRRSRTGRRSQAPEFNQI